MTNTSRKRIFAERDKVLAAADRRGTSKFTAKQELKKEAQAKGEVATNVRGMFSTSTYNTYKKASNQFFSYADTHGGDLKHLRDLRPLVEPYLKQGIEKGWSPWTVNMRAQALATTFQCKVDDFKVKLPRRKREMIKRTRTAPESVGNRYQQEKYAQVRDFISATGLRRKEIYELKQDDLLERPDGLYIIVQKGKGGKYREAPVITGKENIVRQAFKQAAGKEKYVFSKNWIPEHMAVHCYRADYAQNLYQYYLTSGAANGKMYYCRGDKEGASFDKGALLKVSRAMGHNRCNVVVNNYFYNTES
jgi:integrase